MADARLVNYIRQQLNAGYPEDSLRPYLIQYGYPQNIVDEAISAAKKKPLFAFLQKKKANPQIVNYLRQQLNAGYDAGTIKSYLIQYGYPQADVELALDDIYHEMRKVTHVIDLSGKTMFMVVLLFLGLGAIGFGIYYGLTEVSPAATELLDYRLVMENTGLRAGDTLQFDNEFINFGGKRRYDISIEYKIINKETNKEIDSWGETIAVDTTITKSRERKLSDDLPFGYYKLVGIVEYGKILKVEAHTTFRILQPEKEIEAGKAICFDGIKNQAETGIDCGGPCEACETCFDGVKNQDEEGTDCGGICKIPCEEETPPETKPETPPEQPTEQKPAGEVTEDDMLNYYSLNDKAKAAAETNPAQAYDYCTAIAVPYEKDSCYSEIAKLSNLSRFCEGIVNEQKKDACYMSFVTTNKDYTVCDKIANPTYSSLCNNLKTFEEKKTTPGEIVTIVNETKQTQAPVTLPEVENLLINDVNIAGMTNTSAIITWTTNHEANSLVNFGKASGQYNNPKFEAEYILNHTIVLENLVPGTAYYFVIISNTSDLKSNITKEYSFATLT